MSISKLFEKTEEKEFTTFPSTLETYAWYKPILIVIIAAIICLALSFAIFSILRVDPNADDIFRVLYSAISMIALIPGLYIATRLMYKIPFSAQIAPVRKWNWSIYIKVFLISLIIYTLIIIVPLLASGTTITSKYSIPIIIILCLILPIFQGFAEEFLCRGLLMQTFGSWFRIPAVAIFLQAAIFAVLHPYQIYALIGVLCIGLVYGLITWYGQGLECTSAMHAINNMFAFVAIAFGLQQGPAGNSLESFLMNMVLLILPTIIIIALDKKFNWFKSDS